MGLKGKLLAKGIELDRVEWELDGGWVVISIYGKNLKTGRPVYDEFWPQTEGHHPIAMKIFGAPPSKIDEKVVLDFIYTDGDMEETGIQLETTQSEVFELILDRQALEKELARSQNRMKPF